MLGAGLAFAAITGCGQSISSGDPPIVQEKPPVVADNIRVIIMSDPLDDVIDAVLAVRGPTDKDLTITATMRTDLEVTSTKILVTVDSLRPGSYTVAITKAAAGGVAWNLFQDAVKLSGEVGPLAGVSLTRIESNGSTIEVVSEDITDKTIVTTIPVEQPPSTKDFAPDLEPAEVGVSGVEGTVTVSNQSPIEVPPIVDAGGTAQQSVLGAVQIQAPATPDAVVAVKFPVPLISPDEYADAEGGEVDVMVFSYDTFTWEKVGVAELGADGVATANITGLGANNLVAIGKLPAVADESPVEAEPFNTLNSQQVEELKAVSDEYTYEMAPLVLVGSDKPARGSSARVARTTANENLPDGIGTKDMQIWGQIKPNLIAAVREKFKDSSVKSLGDAISGYLTGGVKEVPLNYPDVASVLAESMIALEFAFTYRVGRVTKVYWAKLSTNGVLFVGIGHPEGSGTGGQ